MPFHAHPSKLPDGKITNPDTSICEHTLPRLPINRSYDDLDLTSKHQATIPAKIRKSMNLKPGQHFQIAEVNGKIEIRPILSANQLIGFLKDEAHLEFEREKYDRFL